MCQIISSCQLSLHWTNFCHIPTQAFFVIMIHVPTIFLPIGTPSFERSVQLRFKYYISEGGVVQISKYVMEAHIVAFLFSQSQSLVIFFKIFWLRIFLSFCILILFKLERKSDFKRMFNKFKMMLFKFYVLMELYYEICSPN